MAQALGLFESYTAGNMIIFIRYLLGFKQNEVFKSYLERNRRMHMIHLVKIPPRWQATRLCHVANYPGLASCSFMHKLDCCTSSGDHWQSLRGIQPFSIDVATDFSLLCKKK